jgi:cyclopropane fatty-acyl-phospholipid synthase-like methyltransferase
MVRVEQGLGGFIGVNVDIFELTLFVAEHLPYLIALWVIFIFLARKSARTFAILSLPGMIAVMVTGVLIGSHYGNDYSLAGHHYDDSLPSVRAAVEDYIFHGKGDAHEILESGKYKPSFGFTEMRYLLKDLMRHTLIHTDNHNVDNIDEGYNKGNAWFEATLGKPMVYTSGIYKHGNESLWDAQNYKLDYVANAIDLQKGEHVLDIGCGWGRLAKHFAEKYGAKVTGLTLSSDQLAYGKKLNKGNEKSVNLMLQNAMTHQKDNNPDLYDKITCLEMAEHVGIKRYQEFLTSVRDMMKDDGTLYFQVAGLRRWWQYEDLVWGLFMGEHVFPGADASCPLGWVTTQLERAGFEVQRTQNLGTHYSRTLYQWLEEWLKAEKSLKEKYGEVAWRRWEVFLRWSVRVARQGSSTVFMITATKQGHEPSRVAAQKRLSPIWSKKK